MGYTGYGSYKGKSCGRILHALHIYCSYHMGEYAQIGDGKVWNGKEVVGTYTWIDGIDPEKPVPCFTWMPSLHKSTQDEREQWAKNERMLRPVIDRVIPMMSLRYCVQEVAKKLAINTVASDKLLMATVKKGSWNKWTPEEYEALLPHIKEMANEQVGDWQAHEQWLRSQGIKGIYI